MNSPTDKRGDPIRHESMNISPVLENALDRAGSSLAWPVSLLVRTDRGTD